MPRGVYERAPKGRTIAPFQQCRVADCERNATRRGPVLCEMHYYRERRFTLPSPNPPRRAEPFAARPDPSPRKNAQGYVVVTRPDHPLTTVGKGLLEHRAVYFDAHGGGPFPCHWCSERVDWSNLHIDHLNDIRSDNRLENLVASCAGCNQARGRRKMRATMRDRHAIILTLDGVTQTIAEWASAIGISKNSLKYRLKVGWSLEQALTTPRGVTGPKLGSAQPDAVRTPRRAMGNARRRAVWEATGGLCAGCEKPVAVRGGTVIDHILPLELGGVDDFPNLQILCTECDRGKTRFDLKRIAKMRRQSSMAAEPKPSRLQGRPFPTDNRPKGQKFGKSRGFTPTRPQPKEPA